MTYDNTVKVIFRCSYMETPWRIVQDHLNTVTLLLGVHITQTLGGA